jgi:transcriptional regulator with AAA-type ATPase domain/tetratricopeptide (TPR) repeat protein
MQLLADRFVVGDGTATDLATGERVALTVTAGGTEAEQRRWALECGDLQKLHHPGLPRMIDYGLVGTAARFEARCEVACRTTKNLAGLITIERSAVRTIGEIFERPDSLRPRVAALWGPDGAGKGTVVLELARVARLHGFVPVAARIVSRFAALLSGRSLFVIDDGSGGDGWRVLLCEGLGSSRPHVLLFVGNEEPKSVDGIGLSPVPLDILINAVRPVEGVEGGCANPVDVRQAAARSEGWPGRFARLLWSQGRRARDSDRPDGHSGERVFGRASRGPSLAAEQSVVYGPVEQRSIPASAADERAPVGDLAAIARRMDEGEQLIAEGRHAPGERLLRQAIGALARRHQWSQVAKGATALAALLLTRGRVRDAQDALKEAAEYARHGGDESRAIDVAILDGLAHLEAARVDQAETRLSSAVAAARACGDGERVRSALAALSRTLFWAGRYEAADQALQSIDRHRIDERTAIVVDGRRATIAVGLRRLDDAVAGAVESLDRARRLRDPRLLGAAAYQAAFAHLTVGDMDAVERDGKESVVAARAAREPLLAARGRLLLVEMLRRSSKKAAAARLLAKTVPAAGRRWPPIVRARRDLVRDLLAEDGLREETLARHVATSGLPALALFAPPVRLPSIASAGGVAMVEDVVPILELCQTSDEEHVVLAEVCRRLASRLHAAAVGIAVPQGGRFATLAADGGRLEMAIAERLVAGGITVAPHRCQERLEAGAPIQYGGRTIGALMARWTVGTLHDLTSAASLLTTTAAVVAPIVSAAAVRLCTPPAPTIELIGSSGAMAEVRRGIERAGPAPFPVLIEGESGSGKELVARAIHRMSTRRDRLFATLNCAALPDDLVEAELFGHARGAFTGAAADRTGVFEEAHGGTLMLDEIGELSLRAQAKVLRVIQEGEMRRIGENVSRRVDVRIVSATNRDLRQEVAAGRFRLDLLYRLDVIRIVVPPLRERREDIPALAEQFWALAAARVGSRATLAAATIAALAQYDWPGNVRELQNVLASLVVRCPKRGVVPPSALSSQFANRRLTEASRLDAARRTFEEHFVRAALVRAGGHRIRAAAELGITRQGLAKLMARLGIER